MVFFVTFCTCMVRSCRLTSSRNPPRLASGLSWTSRTRAASNAPITAPPYGSSTHGGPQGWAVTKETVSFVTLKGGIGAVRMTLEERHGAHLSRLPCDDALRRAGRRGDDALLHGEVRQRRQPDPCLRQGGGPGGRNRARTDR